MIKSTLNLPPTPWLMLMALALGALWFNGSLAQGQKPGESSVSPDATAYRRVFVPAESPETWPTGSERYLPVTTRQFEELVRKGRAEKVTSTTVARLSSAEYRAELSDDTLLVGTGSFAIQSPTEEPTITALEPLNLAVLSANWQGAAPVPAKWGLGRKNQSDLIWGVLTPSSGSLQIDWQLRGRQTEDGALMFDLQLPPVVLQTFELTLSAEYRVTLSAAKLIRTEQVSAGRRHWSFQLSSHGPHLLQLFRAVATKVPQVQLRVSQATEYRLQPEGLRLTSSLRYEPRESSTSEIRYSIGRDLRIASVTLDGNPVDWQLRESPTDRELLVHVSNSEKSQEIEFQALAPIKLDQQWLLPTIRPLGDGWTEGTSLVVVSPNLQLLSLSTESATVEHIVGLQSEAASMEAYRVQEWSDGATVNVVIDRRTPRLDVEVATAADLGTNETTARISARISCRDQPTYQISAGIAEGWVIESVKAEPATALREWHVQGEGDKSILRLQLNRSIRPDDPLTIEFDARAQQAGDLLPTNVERLKILRFDEASEQSHLLLLRSRRQETMELLHGLEQARVVLDQLSHSVAALLPSPIVGELVDLTDLDGSQIVSMRPARTKYEARVAAELSITTQTAIQRYEIECQPLDGPISEIAVRFDDPLPPEAKWELLGQEGGTEPRPLRAPEEETNGQSEGVLYLLKLPFAATQNVRLSIQYSAPVQESSVWNAIRFPQATRWNGHIALHGSIADLQVIDSGWIPVGWESSETASRNLLPLLGCYRWESGHTGRSRRSSPLAILKTDAVSVESLVAWLAEFQSHQAADGAAIYSAVYYLENTGAAEVAIEVPEQTELQACWLDEQQLVPSNLQMADRTFRFRLKEGERYPKLALHYVSRGPALGRATTIEPVLPLCSFPVHLSRWTLWTPEQYVPDDLITGYSTRRVPWRQRLFGPLARPVGQEVFQPLRASAWPQLWSAPVEGLRTRMIAEQFVNRLATRMGSDGEQTWGQLLGGLVHAMNIEEIVLIDVSAIQAAEINAKSRPKGSSTLVTKSDLTATNSEQESRRLASHGLVLVVSPSRIIVTTSDRVAHWSEDIHPTGTPRVYYIRSEHLLLDFESSSDISVGDLVTVAQWRAAPEMRIPVWNDSQVSSMSDVGHRACTIEFVDQPPSVVVRRAYVQQAYWYVVWLATVVGGMWWLEQRTDRVILALASATAACMVAPPYWLTIPQAILVGILSAIVLRFVVTYVAKKSRDLSTQAILVRSTPLVFLIFNLLIASETYGTPTLGEQPADDFNLPRVLVPIDNRGEFIGDDIYLSESFYATLQDAQNGLGSDDSSYLLLATAIRGSLQSATQEPSNLAIPWTISFELECLSPRSRIILPLRKSDGIWIDQSCTLDGNVIPLTWRPDGNGCRIDVLGTGVHHLKVMLRPKFDTSGQHSLLKLQIPRMPGVRLELAVPATAKELRIADAGKIQMDDETRIWRTTLAPTDALQLDWAVAAGQQNSEFTSDVDQLSWLRVDKALTRLEVQLMFRGSGAPPRQLQLDFSSQLKLLPPNEHSPIEKIDSNLNKPGTASLVLKSGLSTNLRVPLTFQVQRTASLGNFYFPSVRLKGVTPSRSLFAVSVGSGLSYQEETTESMRSISASEFSSEWGDAKDTPLFAYSLDQEAPEWSLSVWPDPDTFAAQQSMLLLCDSLGMQVNYNATISQVIGKCLVHRLQVPEVLEIDEINVVEQSDGKTLPVRWSHSNSSHVTVFLSRPTNQPHILSLRGRTRPNPDGIVATPNIVLRGADRGEVRMDLYRDPSLLVDWVDPITAPSEIVSESVTSDSTGIFVGQYAWRADDLTSNRQLRVRGNQRRFTADTVTQISSSDVGHTVSLKARIDVQDGVVAQLNISMPDNFREPYVLQPTSLGIVGQSTKSPLGRQVTLLLNEPVAASESVELQLSGQLPSSGEGLLAIPDLVVNNASGGRRYIMLPTQLDLRVMEWQTDGLKREALPEELSHFVPTSIYELPYLVENKQFFAHEPAYRGPLRKAALRHAWVDGVLDARGSLTATATFILQPGQATHCSVLLPEGARLMQLVTDDLPARREELTEGVWKIPLGPPFLPRVIKISYLLESDYLEDRMRLLPPEVLIGDAALPCPRINWIVRPVGGLRIRPTEVGSASSRVTEADSRYRHLVEAWNDSTPLATELPIEETSPWFRAWRTHLEIAGQKSETWNASTTTLPSVNLEPLVDGTSTPGTSLFENIAKPKLVEPIAAPSAYPPEIPQRPTSSLGKGAVYLTTDAAGQLEIECSQLADANGWRWFAAAVILVAGILLEKRSQIHPEWLSAIRQRPHALALGIGVIWWSLLAPSAVGLLIVVFTFLSLALRLWRKRHPSEVANISTQLTARVS